MGSIWLSPLSNPKRFNFGVMKIQKDQVLIFNDGRLRVFRYFEDAMNFCFSFPNGFRWFSHSESSDYMIRVMKAIINKYKFYIGNSERFLSVEVDEDKTIWFCNAYALFPFSLKENLLEPLHKKIWNFYKAYGAGGYGHTIAEQALLLWRATVPKNELRMLWKTHEAFVRQGFFGGRTEVFTRWGKDLKIYDIQSAFGYGMLQEMPSGNPIWTDKFNEEKAGFFECEVKINGKTDIPALPTKKDDKTVFPVGRFKTYLSIPEINYGRNQGYDIKTGLGLVFSKKTTSLFTNYVNKFFTDKQASEKGEFDYTLSKLFMVTLFGKLGQSRESLAMYADDGKSGQPILINGEETGYIQREFTKQARYILPHVAAYITAHARIKHHQLMIETEKVYYCDTDSIVCNTPLPTGDGIGNLRQEDIITEGIFLLPKTYAYHNCSRDVVKAKGFAKGLTYADFERALKGDYKGLSLEWEKAPTIREYLKFGSEEPITVKRVMKGLFYKRILQPDGINTKALNLGG